MPESIIKGLVIGDGDGEGGDIILCGGNSTEMIYRPINSWVLLGPGGKLVRFELCAVEQGFTYWTELTAEREDGKTAVIRDIDMKDWTELKATRALLTQMSTSE